MREMISDIVRQAIYDDDMHIDCAENAAADKILAILPDYEAQQARIDKLEAELNEAETLLSELQAIARNALKEAE